MRNLNFKHKTHLLPLLCDRHHHDGHDRHDHHSGNHEQNAQVHHIGNNHDSTTFSNLSFKNKGEKTLKLFTYFT